MAGRISWTRLRRGRRLYDLVSTVSLALLSVFFLATHMEVLAAMCGGYFLLGLGERINHPTADVSRKANWLGILLEGAGMVLIIFGIYLWFRP